jgi:hypothetical protein
MRTQSEIIKTACQVLRSKALFKTAMFGLIDGENETFPNEKDTDKIRAATRIYMQSWVIPILDELEKGNFEIVDYLCQGHKKTPME